MIKAIAVVIAMAAALAVGAVALRQRHDPNAAAAVEKHPALGTVADLIDSGQLDEARRQLADAGPSREATDLRRMLDARAALARSLTNRSSLDMARADLTQAGRRLAWAVSLDGAMRASAEAAEHQQRSQRVDAELSRAHACAGQRNFQCVQEVIAAVRELDRHSAAAQFWEFYVADWRPDPPVSMKEGS